VRLPRPDGHDGTRSVLEAIAGGTALAALPGLHRLGGALLDPVAIRRRLRAVRSGGVGDFGGLMN
jgi:hypothetical protein